MLVSPDALPRMAPADYLNHERQQEVRHELVDGYLYAMTGASDRHEEIALNLASALRVHLRGSPNCRVYKGDLKIRQADDFYYPDVFVRCADDRGDPYFKTDPVFIAEVLSPGTQRYDRGDKQLAYFRLPTLKSYTLISQDEPRVTLLHADGRETKTLTSPDHLLVIEKIGFSMSLADLYE